MTATEFRVAAKKCGMGDHQIDMQISLQERLRREGITPVPYEVALAALQKHSCMEVFDLVNVDKHPNAFAMA